MHTLFLNLQRLRGMCLDLHHQTNLQCALVWDLSVYNQFPMGIIKSGRSCVEMQPVRATNCVTQR